jgi:hypothetical protein
LIFFSSIKNAEIWKFSSMVELVLGKALNSISSTATTTKGLDRDVEECFPSMCEALGSLPDTGRKKKKKKRKSHKYYGLR